MSYQVSLSDEVPSVIRKYFVQTEIGKQDFVLVVGQFW